jgi:hypothetical protein
MVSNFSVLTLTKVKENQKQSRAVQDAKVKEPGISGSLLAKRKRHAARRRCGRARGVSGRVGAREGLDLAKSNCPSACPIHNTNLVSFDTSCYEQNKSVKVEW